MTCSVLFNIVCVIIILATINYCLYCIIKPLHYGVENMFKTRYRILQTDINEYKIQQRNFFVWKCCYAYGTITSLKTAKKLLVEFINKKEFKQIITNVTIKNNPEVIFEEETNNA